MLPPELVNVVPAIMLALVTLILAEIRKTYRAREGEWRCPASCDPVCRCPDRSVDAPASEIKATPAHEKGANGT